MSISKRKSKSSRVKKVIFAFSLVIVFVFFTLFVTITIFYNKYNLDVDKLTSLNNGVKVYSATSTDSNSYNTNRSIVDIEELPEYVLNAFIDTEDGRFYSHNGYDFARIIKAGIVNFTSKSKSQGASTISQQLVKNALLTNEKTYSRKIQEIVLAVKMEKQFSKQEILQMYLNTIYFGSNAYGIENASKIYFNKSAKELTLNEACCLAGLIKSPSNYSPRTNYENSVKRKNYVALSLLKKGDISSEEYQNIINSDIAICEYTENDHSYEEMAILEACSLLNVTERTLINNEYEIITNKDEQIQNDVVTANCEIITNAEESTKSHLDSMSIVVDNSGKVRAYFENSNYNLHNMRRQPASTLKPLAVYLPCIIHNILTPASLILDEQIDYGGYSPSNADGLFHGYVTARYALSNSLNIPAVKALDYVGINRARDTLSSLGINISNNDLNLSLALGATKSGINLLDLVSAYSIIANLGVYKGLTFIDKILDKNGNIVYSSSDFSEKIFNEEDCFLLTDMLKDTAKTGSAKRLNSLNLNLASKTGTASNGNYNTDLYNIAYTSEHTILTWIADIKNNRLPANIHSSVEPTEINKKILLNLYYDRKPEDFSQPDTVEKFPYDTLEADENHRIVSPTTTSARYIAYDYFKKNLPPERLELNDDFKFQVSLDQYGANINFKARKNSSYNIYKKVNEKTLLLKEIKDIAGDVDFIDKDVFNYEEIVYYIETNKKSSSQIRVKPKDFLINLLNQQMLKGKKKWYV